MRLLAIETSCRRGGIALLRNGSLLTEIFFEEGMVHGRLLLPKLEEALNEAGWRIDDVEAVAVDEGPGSFTGLRIGAMVAKTLCWLTGARLVGVLSTDVLFRAALESGLEEPVAVLIDAYRGSLYTALYRNGRAFVDLMKPDEVVRRLPGGAVLGDGALRWREFFSGGGFRVVEEPAFPPPRWVGFLAMKALQSGGGVDPVRFVPRYLRPSEAEERKGINASPDRLKPAK